MKKYFFIRYVYRQELYTAIWDKKNQIFIANTKADNSDAYGIVSRNENNYGFTKYRTPTGKEIKIPILSYADGKLYGVLDAEDAMVFIPNIVYDDNPVILVIAIE